MTHIINKYFIFNVFPHLFTRRGKLVWVWGQGFEVLRDGLEMGNLSQHRNLLILQGQDM